MIFKYKGREVDLQFYGYGDHGDDIQCHEAAYLDTGAELTDVEVDEIMEANAGKIEQEQYENMMCHACDFHEGER